jgi:TetR/AcrR family transcriptional repressor of nem operon
MLPPMARTKAFAPEVAVDRALDLFWRQGYEATSTQALVEELRLNRSSLYGTFHSKAALYERALERYAERSEAGMREALAGPGPLKPKLRALMLAMVEEDLGPGGPRGCFAGNSAVELARADEAILALTRRTFARIRAVLAEALAAAAERGELRPAAAERGEPGPAADPQALAGFLLTTLQGLRVVAKGTRDRRLLEQSVEHALAAL